jgi:hypothetical protein
VASRSSSFRRIVGSKSVLSGVPSAVALSRLAPRLSVMSMFVSGSGRQWSNWYVVYGPWWIRTTVPGPTHLRSRRQGTGLTRLGGTLPARATGRWPVRFDVARSQPVSSLSVPPGDSAFGSVVAELRPRHLSRQPCRPVVPVPLSTSRCHRRSLAPSRLAASPRPAARCAHEPPQHRHTPSRRTRTRADGSKQPDRPAAHRSHTHHHAAATASAQAARNRQQPPPAHAARLIICLWRPLSRDTPATCSMLASLYLSAGTISSRPERSIPHGARAA